MLLFHIVKVLFLTNVLIIVQQSWKGGQAGSAPHGDWGTRAPSTLTFTSLTALEFPVLGKGVCKSSMYVSKAMVYKWKFWIPSYSVGKADAWPCLWRSWAVLGNVVSGSMSPSHAPKTDGWLSIFVMVSYIISEISPHSSQKLPFTLYLNFYIADNRIGS